MTLYNFVNVFLKRIGKQNVKISFKAKINKNTILEGYSRIYEKANICDSYIGLGTYIASNSNLSRCKIGRFCSIASNVDIIRGRHPSKIFVSTHPAFYSLSKPSGFTFTDRQLFDELKYIDDAKKYSVEIGNDVWIGANVKIMDGVRIGNGAIIGANSLVNKNIEPYSICVGIPVKTIGYRFEKEDIEFLENFQWWNRDFEWIRTNYDKFRDIQLLKEFVNLTEASR